ncbi:MAG: hypothetical protein OXG35_02930 [Acidobacteria bacterium]|nr:hypothetical protein [Acidobacteriota bacterium]
MTEETTGSGNPFARARRGGYARWALIIGTAWAIQLIAPTALLSNETPGATTHLVPLFPEGRDGSGKEGFIRIVNYSTEHGTVRITAFDADGRDYGPVTLAIDGGRTIHLNADDLAQGNPARGVSGATGSGWGAGRLELSSALDITVSSYIRHRDGFLTSMHDVVPREGNRYHVPTFNPGRESNQASRLRLINTNRESTAVRIRGIDDRGVSSREATVDVPGGATRELTAAELESGAGMNGALGDGAGKWRLLLESEDHLVVMNLLETPTGHLTNLSTVPHATKNGAWTVPLFPGASNPWGRQGLVRIINHSARAGEVRIATIDDGGRRHPPFATPIGAGRTVHLDSHEVEEELTGGAGSGAGSRRLVVSSDLDIEVLSYIEHSDGLLASMHDVAPLEGHRVSTFDPGSGLGRGSRLRLINTGEEQAQITVEALDEHGSSPGSAFEVTVPGGAAREFTAAQLGFGDRIAGDPGDGLRNWRLLIESEQTVEAMSLLDGSTGHLTNQSTEPRRDPVAAEDHWAETSRGDPAGVVVAVVDGQGFDPGTHGQRIADTFLDHTRHASLVQIRGWGTYALNGSAVRGTNQGGLVRHELTRAGGIFWTSTDDSPTYLPDRTWSWFVKHGRPFSRSARELANWMRDRDVLFISSLENPTCRLTPEGCVAIYCDNFELNEEGWWIPLCGAVDDYVAHSGVGLDTVIFAGALSGDYASGAIRADGVFAPHAVYVESPDGSTSHATPVLAAYATNLSFANPSWGAARLKRELMALAREETVEYITGGADESGTTVTERRTVKAIRPPGPAADPPVGGANQRPVAIGTLPPRRLAPRATQAVDLSEAFVDPDGDTLTYAASSSAPGVVTARTAGARVMLTAISVGSSTIEVTATDPGGLSATHSLAVTVSTSLSFTDDPIRPGVTPVRAVHFTELRSRIDGVRQAAGLPPYAWTDPVLIAGVTPVRLVHVLELRTALERAYAATRRSAPRWSDPTPVAATAIRAVHLTELRAAVVALE